MYRKRKSTAIRESFLVGEADHHLHDHPKQRQARARNIRCYKTFNQVHSKRDLPEDIGSLSQRRSIRVETILISNKTKIDIVNDINASNWIHRLNSRTNPWVTGEITNLRYKIFVLARVRLKWSQ